LAWPVRLELVACVGAAIWQEPRLSPWVHERMQETAAYAQSVMEGGSGAGALFAGLGRSSSSGNDAGLSGWFIDTVMR